MAETPPATRSRTDIVVVDASFAVKWVLDEDRRDEALAMLAEWERAATMRLVPGWFACEVANVFYKLLKRGDISLLQATGGVESVLDSVTVRDTDVATSIRGVEIAHALGRPASYDAHYLAFAEGLGCEVWTADERLWNAARGDFPWVRWLGEGASRSPVDSPD